MSAIQHFTTEQAREFAEKFGVDWDWSFSKVEQFPMKFDPELDHGWHDPSVDASGNDAIFIGKISRDCLNEFPDYHSRLEMLEGKSVRKAFGV